MLTHCTSVIESHITRCERSKSNIKSEEELEGGELGYQGTVLCQIQLSWSVFTWFVHCLDGNGEHNDEDEVNGM